jgi:hypothetical protein
MQGSTARLDLTGVLKDAPIGEWLALSFARDRLVAHAPTLKAAMDAAKSLGESQPIMMKLPPFGMLVL